MLCWKNNIEMREGGFLKYHVDDCRFIHISGLVPYQSNTILEVFLLTESCAIVDYLRYESYVTVRVTQTFQSFVQSSLRNQNYILDFISNIIFIGNIGLNEMIRFCDVIGYTINRIKIESKMADSPV